MVCSFTEWCLLRVLEANEHTPFLDEIRNAKDFQELESVILMYADWLEEAGDPFGEEMREFARHVPAHHAMRQMYNQASGLGSSQQQRFNDELLIELKQRTLKFISEKGLASGAEKRLPSVEEVEKDLVAFGQRRDEVRQGVRFYDVSTVKLNNFDPLHRRDNSRQHRRFGKHNYETLVTPSTSFIELWGTRYETAKEAARGHVQALMKTRQGTMNFDARRPTTPYG